MSLDGIDTGQVAWLASGADPWVLKHGDAYLYCRSTGDRIELRRASILRGLADAAPVAVWKGNSGGKWSKELWAPELHRIDGVWTIYVAADDGRNENHRMIVLQREEDDPLGAFRFLGPLRLDPDRWAIDGTWCDLGDRGRYFLWSGWDGERNVAQHLYICPMRTATGPAGPRVRISSPEFDWERRGSGGPDRLPTINEGPQILRRDGWLHVIYSASGSWCDDYCLGRLSLPPGRDPLDPTAWIKHPEPVFSRTDAVLGPGHASFTTTPDGTDWIVYHSARKTGSGWDRQVRLQPFRWDGVHPVFGRPGEPPVRP